MFALAWQEVKECKRIYVQAYIHACMHTYIHMYKWLWSNGSPVRTEISAIKMSFARGRRKKVCRDRFLSRGFIISYYLALSVLVQL